MHGMFALKNSPMITDKLLPQDGVNASHEHERPRRCGWIALGLVLLLLQGILPGSLLGGVAGLKSAELMLGQHAGSDLIGRLFVLGGMIMGLMVSAVVIMTLTLALIRTSAVFLKRPVPAALRARPGKDPDAGRK
jgi:hypothetical protein